MGIPEPDGLKSLVLNDEVVIASHIHKFDIAERAPPQAPTRCAEAGRAVGQRRLQTPD